MKAVTQIINQWGQDEIAEIEKNDAFEIEVDGEKHTLKLEDVEITSQDIPGWSVASEAGITVALDISIDDDLRREGFARDLVNRIQNLRKEKGLEVQDKIAVAVKQGNELVDTAISQNKDYICSETQAVSLDLADNLTETTELEIDDLTVELSVVVKNQ
jgi:isoleucyl-tRNA synthetase